MEIEAAEPQHTTVQPDLRCHENSFVTLLKYLVILCFLAVLESKKHY